ncbi:hypothetical protein GM661_00140 [Iocasia frigidifontis]|uniref:Uncharacterized protein n=1 Tax=Iocasia fonsfrigidae TaxID=2682810 RepID=A0A8A7KAX8_9FIRM|nr:MULTISPECIES: hypothetical protein [Halanaerobiaceae]QTL96489.1 hypothetical protein GM661_00140 [Iocasia fonsfrigidae]
MQIKLKRNKKRGVERAIKLKDLEIAKENEFKILNKKPANKTHYGQNDKK